MLFCQHAGFYQSVPQSGFPGLGSHWMQAKLAAGSLLVYAPDPIQAFRVPRNPTAKVFSATRQRAGAWWIGSAPAVRRGASVGLLNRFQSRNEVFPA